MDCKVRAGEAFPFTPLTRLPKVPGGDLAGLVEQVAPGSPFKPVSPPGQLSFGKKRPCLYHRTSRLGSGAIASYNSSPEWHMRQ